MKRRSIAITCAVVLISPILAKADAGLPRLSSPDWSSLSTPQWAGVGLFLTLDIAWLGLWASKRPAAAIGSLLWLLGLPFLTIGGLLVAWGVGFRAYQAIPFAAAGLGVATGFAIAGYKVMKADDQWSGRAVVPGLVGLFVLVLILGLTCSALRWTDPGDPNRPVIRPGAGKVLRGRNPDRPSIPPRVPVTPPVNEPQQLPANNPPAEKSRSPDPNPSGFDR